MIAIVLLGGLMVGMIGTLFTAVRASSQLRAASVAEAEGRRFMEEVRAVSYQPCAEPDASILNPYATGDQLGQSTSMTNSYDDAFDTNPDVDGAIVTAKIVDIDYWMGDYQSDNVTPVFVSATYGVDGGGAPTTTCGPTQADGQPVWDCGIQQITIHVTVTFDTQPATTSDADMTFIKRSEAVSGC